MASLENINWKNLVGDKQLGNGGYVGDLMTLAREHIDDAVAKNRITRDQAGEIYTAMIPAAFQTALSYSMK